MATDSPDRQRPGSARPGSQEFFCVSEQPFAPGAELECDLIACGDRVLRCRLEVVRVELRGLTPGFGIVCRLRSYVPARFTAGWSISRYPGSIS